MLHCKRGVWRTLWICAYLRLLCVEDLLHSFCTLCTLKFILRYGRHASFLTATQEEWTARTNYSYFSSGSLSESFSRRGHSLCIPLSRSLLGSRTDVNNSPLFLRPVRQAGINVSDARTLPPHVTLPF